MAGKPSIELDDYPSNASCKKTRMMFPCHVKWPDFLSLVDPAIQCYPPFFLVHLLPQPWVGVIQAHFQVLKGAVDSQGGAEGGRTWGNYWEVGAIPRPIPSRKYHKIPYQWAHSEFLWENHRTKWENWPASHVGVPGGIIPKIDIDPER